MTEETEQIEKTENRRTSVSDEEKAEMLSCSLLHGVTRILFIAGFIFLTYFCYPIPIEVLNEIGIGVDGINIFLISCVMIFYMVDIVLAALLYKGIINNFKLVIEVNDSTSFFCSLAIFLVLIYSVHFAFISTGWYIGLILGYILLLFFIGSNNYKYPQLIIDDDNDNKQPFEPLFDKLKNKLLKYSRKEKEGC